MKSDGRGPPPAAEFALRRDLTRPLRGGYNPECGDASAPVRPHPKGGETLNVSPSVRRILTVAVGAALLTVCSWISIPLTIPFTLQTFAVCLISALFGAPSALLSLLVYVLLGLAGIPVFAGFRGGAGVLLGATGGYILGFFFTALIVGLTASARKHGLPSLIVSMAAGVLVCYAFGTAWFMTVYARNTGPVCLGTALGWCVFPYLIPDAVKILLAAWLARRLYPVLARKRNGA